MSPGDATEFRTHCCDAPYEFLEITSVPSMLTVDGDSFDVSVRFRIYAQGRNMKLKVSFKSATALVDQARVVMYLY